MSHSSDRIARQRSERRISVRLPVHIWGHDARGRAFEEETASENLCRSGAAFRTRLELAVGSNLQIRIPLHGPASRRTENDFETLGRVVHVSATPTEGERVVGVQFIGPRFQRVFRSESAA